MEIRVPLPRERVRPAGSAGPVRPAHRQVDPGEQANDRRHDDGRQQHDGRRQQPSSHSDIGGQVDKTA